MIIILFNNKFSSSENTKISVLSDSFARGYGVFETLRTYGNKKEGPAKIFKAKEHIARLFKSAKTIGLKIKYSQAAVCKMLLKIVKKSSHQLQRLKIIAIKEGIIIISEPIKIKSEIYQGVSCKSIKCLRSLPEVKSISYLPSYLSHKQAVKAGYYEAILIDKHGEVFEAAYSNIFWFEGTTLCTRKDNVLEGITRQTILKISPFPIKFKTINLKDLYKKSEVFLTGSVIGIVPVIKIDRCKIGNGKAGEKTKILMELFKRSLKQKISSSHTAL